MKSFVSKRILIMKRGGGGFDLDRDSRINRINKKIRRIIDMWIDRGIDRRNFK